jgi:hypothetical protein
MNTKTANMRLTTETLTRAKTTNIEPRGMSDNNTTKIGEFEVVAGQAPDPGNPSGDPLSSNSSDDDDNGHDIDGNGSDYEEEGPSAAKVLLSIV